MARSYLKLAGSDLESGMLTRFTVPIWSYLEFFPEFAVPMQKNICCIYNLKMLVPKIPHITLLYCSSLTMAMLLGHILITR
jgi:hypothetical protein